MDWRYIAGFIDGEGSIVTTDNGRVIISISNTHIGVLKTMRNFIGCGSIRVYDPKKPYWKPAGIYVINNHKDVLKILKKIKPFLVIKKEKAEKGILFIENKKWKSKMIIPENRIIKLHKKGLSSYKIGEIFNVSSSTILNRIKEIRDFDVKAA